MSLRFRLEVAGGTQGGRIGPLRELAHGADAPEVVPDEGDAPAVPALEAQEDAAGGLGPAPPDQDVPSLSQADERGGAGRVRTGQMADSGPLDVIQHEGLPAVGLVGLKPHVVGPLAFDDCGSDPRWRPFVAAALPEGSECTPLLELRDEKGGGYGTGAVYAVHQAGPLRGGRLVYAWFGLLRHPQADLLMHDLFDLAAGKAEKK